MMRVPPPKTEPIIPAQVKKMLVGGTIMVVMLIVLAAHVDDETRRVSLLCVLASTLAFRAYGRRLDEQYPQKQ